MQISLSWLKQIIELPESPDQIAGLLTGSGLEVEHIIRSQAIKGGLEGLVIGSVLTCIPHPDADKLRLTSVQVAPDLVLSIVCGAPNVAAGQRVVVAMIGATLYPSAGEPFRIKKSKIRGQLSEGMLCAEDEIGLGGGHDGILVLETELPDGTPAAAYFGLADNYTFEIGLTPNRADAACHLGVARDLKALLNRPATLPTLPSFGYQTDAPLTIDLTIENPQACPFYSGLIIENIQIGPSPDWLAARLISIGQSPINNVVDITNYIMHEMGQPLHAFDLKSIEDGKIIVRNSISGETLTTLDGAERVLPDGLLVIANSSEPICLAGLMGGKNSGVSQDTTAIFLESACFGGEAVRKAAQATGLHTEASFRFERGTDPTAPLLALERAAAMIAEILPEVRIYKPVCLPAQMTAKKHSISVSYAYLHKIIGLQIEPKRIIEILENLDFEFVDKQEDGFDGFSVLVPAYRIEIKREADIAEEILRIYGLDNIPLNPFYGSSYLAPASAQDTEKTQADIARLLAGQGFFEQMSLSQTNPVYFQSLEDLFPPDGRVNLLNPLSHELSLMRPSLLFSGLETLAYNLNRKQQDLYFFEFGKIYSYLPDAQNYQERLMVGLWLSGNANTETWLRKSQPVGFAQLVGPIMQIFARLGVVVSSRPIADNPLFSYGLEYVVHDNVIAVAGLVDAQLAKKAGLKQKAFFGQIDWQLLIKKRKKMLKYTEISKFPQVRRDLSLVIDTAISYQQIYNLAYKTEKKLLSDINVFDVYEGENLGINKKSYSISFILQDSSQTLTDAIIDPIMNKLIYNFESQLGAVIRRGN